MNHCSGSGSQNVFKWSKTADDGYLESVCRIYEWISEGSCGSFCQLWCYLCAVLGLGLFQCMRGRKSKLWPKPTSLYCREHWESFIFIPLLQNLIQSVHLQFVAECVRVLSGRDQLVKGHIILLKSLSLCNMDVF